MEMLQFVIGMVIVLYSIRFLLVILDVVISVNISVNRYRKWAEQNGGGQDGNGENGRNSEEDQHFPTREKTETTYFSGCDSIEEARKQFAGLMKKHHPDNGGDVKIALEIIREYEEFKRVHVN